MVDPLRNLQVAARSAAAHVCPGRAAGRVIIMDGNGCKLLDVAVPAGGSEPEKEKPVARGWHITDSSATFGGKPIEIASSRLDLLRVLVDATSSLTAKELTAKAFDSETDEANTRYHIRELKRELKTAFPGFEEEMLEGGAEGYRLKLRR